MVGTRKGFFSLSSTHSSIPHGCLVYSGGGNLTARIIAQSLTIDSSIIQVLQFSSDALSSFEHMWHLQDATHSVET